jgi:ATP-dependent DNA helicase DinG
LNIAETLPKVLFERLNTCILSSATLSVAGQFDYLKKRLGLNTLIHQPVHAVAVDSPFNYAEQSRVLIPSFLPDPSHPAFSGNISDLLSEILTVYKRGTLVLFTSYSLMQACYTALKEPLRRSGLTLLCQGQDVSRTHLTRRFREEHTSVLFGTDSFWEGVDVPGEALELLVITKLPFEVPSDPLVVAKMERIQSEGGNSFFDYSVPEAVIKFRQGFGRLIRHKNDRGVVIILDNRLNTKAYGKLFINSLPTNVQRIPDKEQLLSSLNSFF